MSVKLAISAGVLFLLLGSMAPAYAQREQEREQAKPQQHEQARPAPQHAQAKPAQQPHQPPAKAAPRAARPQPSYGGVYHGGVQANGPTNGGVHHSGVPQHQGQVRSGFVQSRAKSWGTDHRSWRERGGYNGYRIPEDRFRAYFGHDHFFRIYGLPLVFVGGYPRFQYDGYWVTFVDPWPDTWPDDWYQTDDVYLDYTDDGYYLYDRSRPGVGIAVTVAF
jgi:hypothetical protein